MNIKYDKIWRKINGLFINKIDICIFNIVYYDKICNICIGYYLIFDLVMLNLICIYDLFLFLCSFLFIFIGVKKGFLVLKGLKINY